MSEQKPKRTRKPRTKSKGLGDSIEKVTKATGIDKAVKFIAGEDCGCDKRKEFLKKLVKMMVNLKDIRQKKPDLRTVFGGMKKGKLYSIPLDSTENGFYKMLMNKEDLPDDIQTFSLFASSNKAPAVFKGIRKKDDERFAVFDMIGPDNTMKDKLFSLYDFAFYKKAGTIHGIGKTGKNSEAYNYLRDVIENQ